MTSVFIVAKGADVQCQQKSELIFQNTFDINSILYRMQQHREHHKQQSYPFKCNKCGVPYRTESLLKQHLAKLHKSANDDNINPKVSRSSTPSISESASIAVLRVAEEAMTKYKAFTTYNAISAVFPCAYCDSDFSSECTLTVHERRVHSQ